jgi:hypothetical protein
MTFVLRILPDTTEASHRLLGIERERTIIHTPRINTQCL